MSFVNVRLYFLTKNCFLGYKLIYIICYNLLDMTRRLREPYMNGELLFRKYFEMGAGASAVRLAKWAVSVGMAKPVKKMKGNPDGVPVMGVWKAMWRWASLKENKETAYKIFSDYLDQYGWEQDTDFPWEDTTQSRKDIWNKFMLKKVQTSWQFRPHRHERFLRENGWL